eukprot:4689549-Ditylum_brightwellii.AAC.1
MHPTLVKYNGGKTKGINMIYTAWRIIVASTTTTTNSKVLSHNCLTFVKYEGGKTKGNNMIYTAWRISIDDYMLLQ